MTEEDLKTEAAIFKVKAKHPDAGCKAIGDRPWQTHSMKHADGTVEKTLAYTQGGYYISASGISGEQLLGHGPDCKSAWIDAAEKVGP